MLRIANTEVRLGHRGELRVVVAAARPAGPHPVELGQVRAYLVADLIRRYAERSGLAPTVVDFSPGNEKRLRAVCGALNIHPPRHTLTGPFEGQRGGQLGGQLGGLFHDAHREVHRRKPVFDVGVRLEGQAEPGASTPDESLAPCWIAVPADAEEVDLGEEPLGVRLKILGFDDEPARTIQRWRAGVAKWANSPSGAMSRPHAEAIAAAFSDNLDAAAALRVLAELEADDSVPDGVKFETFVGADRMFGLDLARDIGRW
jgi:hypothetical protein